MHDDPREHATRASNGYIEIASATSVGPREENQDRVAVAQRWVVLSDGMGGHAGGARAAQLTVDTAIDGLADADPFDRQMLADIVQSCNLAVRAGQAADEDVADMGATITMMVATELTPEASMWLIGSVGDSPAWHVTPVGAIRMTVDHTLTAELVRSGAISPESESTHPGRHVLLRAIGIDPKVTPDIAAVVLTHGDSVVISSDCLSDVLDTDDVHDIVAQASSAADAAQRLVDAALARGTRDNVTVAVVHHLEP
jgi:protein phosphatase